MASPIPWTWVWVNSGSWWWTGRPGVLQSMGSQRVKHGLASEQFLPRPALTDVSCLDKARIWDRSTFINSHASVAKLYLWELKELDESNISLMLHKVTSDPLSSLFCKCIFFSLNIITDFPHQSFSPGEKWLDLIFCISNPKIGNLIPQYCLGKLLGFLWQIEEYGNRCIFLMCFISKTEGQEHVRHSLVSGVAAKSL